MAVRTTLVRLHRWAGLAMAGFLVLAGLTGSVLAWNGELDAWLNPGLFLARADARPAAERQTATPAASAAPAAPAIIGTPLMDPLALRLLVLQRHPGARVDFVPLAPQPGRTLMFMLQPAPGAGLPLADDQVFINPYTGEIQGARRYGDIGQGRRNVLPFIYRLHRALALEPLGAWLLGAIALLWTLDCFAGAWLTFPPQAGRRRHPASPSGNGWRSRFAHWLRRWLPSWKVRRGAGRYKLQVDLHRAGGLWLWLLLLAIAWSGVAFNLPQVYHPLMRAAFSHQAGDGGIRALPSPQAQPGMDWHQARATGRALMRAEAERHGFAIVRDDALYYDAATATFRYDALSSADLRRDMGGTSLWFDANTGAMRGLWLPTGGAAGDTAGTWLTSLHMAAFGGWPLKLLICAAGLATAMLSATGIVIWRRKRAARR